MPNNNLNEITYETEEPCITTKKNNHWEAKYPKDLLESDGFIKKHELAEMLGVPTDSLPASKLHDGVYDSLIYTKCTLAESLFNDINWTPLCSPDVDDTEKDRILDRLDLILQENLGILYPYHGLSYFTTRDLEFNMPVFCLEIRLCGKRFLLFRFKPVITYKETYI